MATRRTARKKTAKKSTAKKTRTTAKKPPTPAQRAHQVTWQLMGELKRTQIGFLRVGRMLAQVRDEKLFADLKYADIETYAQERLHLGRTSLYQYLRVHDWVNRKHQEWLDPKPGVVIPNFTDIGDLIWIEAQLDEKGLEKETRAKLEELHAKALDGSLRRSELTQCRRSRQSGDSSVKSVATSLRHARKRLAALKPPMPEAIAQLDVLLDMLGHAQVLKIARLDDVFEPQTPVSRQAIYA